jgi:hypothetical protein
MMAGSQKPKLISKKQPMMVYVLTSIQRDGSIVCSLCSYLGEIEITSPQTLLACMYNTCHNYILAKSRQLAQLLAPTQHSGEMWRQTTAFKIQLRQEVGASNTV